jgi:hypothetical protein
LLHFFFLFSNAILSSAAPRSSRSKLNFISVHSVKKQALDQEQIPEDVQVETSASISFIDKICQAAVVNQETEAEADKEEVTNFST